MNKEVIKKYKDVFDYWLDGGKVWTKPNVPNGEWHIITTPTFEKDYKYVQDDKYSDLRKAQADGKVIQGLATRHLGWVDIKHSKFTDSVTDYSIKPDEPKFKQGDWIVRPDGTLKQYQSMYSIGKEWELWQPQEGELVVVDDGTDTYLVAPYNKLKDDASFIIKPLEFIATLKDR